MRRSGRPTDSVTSHPPTIAALRRLPARMLAAVLALATATLVGVTGPAEANSRPDRARTDATYFNDARTPAADPYVLYDKASGYYYAYSTSGADRGWHFGIYRSADLATWRKMPGGALPSDDANQWGHDWFWAPEVYHNPKTGLYFLFYAARMNTHVAQYFGYADFEEPSKIGVAVSRSPAGPFHNIADHPIDYYPFDPNYHDVNLIMGPDQKKPPATHEEGLTAPTGTYIPSIDPNVLFDNGRIYLYYSRNAYRNWVWDDDLHKYIEESNIYAVGLTSAWWNDPSGHTMPTITPRFYNTYQGQGDEPGARKDGWVRILDYDHDKQAWENADVDDYAKTHGRLKDRRWEEGSTTWKRYVHKNGKRVAVYYLTYSANNFASPQYGVGYATAPSPLGPWTKHPANPILSQNPDIGMYSTGHGSLVHSPDGRQMYYVHHGRPTPTDPVRRLYTDRMSLGPQVDTHGDPVLRIDQATSDRPIPSGVAPYSMRASSRHLSLRTGSTAELSWQVATAAGAHLALDNPLNRVRVHIDDPAVASVQQTAAGTARILAHAAGHTRITLTYQRESSTGGYRDVHNLAPGRGPAGPGRRPVSVTVSVTVRG